MKNTQLTCWSRFGGQTPPLDQRGITYNIGEPMTTNSPLRVFLCHSSNDKPTVRESPHAKHQFQFEHKGWL